MSILLIVIHIIVCVALILIVLLQTGKGANMGAAFGGGASQTLFGSTGASTFLSKATTVAAIVFMVTSLGLAYFSTHKTGSSIMTDIQPAVEQEAAPGAMPPAADPAPAKPPAETPAAEAPAGSAAQ